jgi:hypothetical protein
MTPAGKTIELKRYRIPTGQRALQAQRIDGRVAVTDVPVDHDDRVYPVERHVTSQAELEGIATEYAERSESCGMPAMLAALRFAADPPSRPTDGCVLDRRRGGALLHTCSSVTREGGVALRKPSSARRQHGHAVSRPSRATAHVPAARTRAVDTRKQR